MFHCMYITHFVYLLSSTDDHVARLHLFLLLFRRWVMSNSLRPLGLYHAMYLCPSVPPGVCSNSIHWVSDAIQPSHPLSPPSPPAFNLSQRQGLFQWVSSLHQVAKYWNCSFSISPSNEYSGLISLGLAGLICLQSKRLSRVFPSTTVWKQQFLGTQPSLWSNCHIREWKNHSFEYTDFCQQSDVSVF